MWPSDSTAMATTSPRKNRIDGRGGRRCIEVGGRVRFNAMIRLVLFDIDGTLVHTGGAGVKAFAQAFRTEFGIADGTERLKFAGRTDVSLVREFFALHQVDPSPENFRRFFDVYVFWLQKIIADCAGGPCLGVPQFYDTLRSVARPPLIGLLTGNIRRGARIKLGHYDLWEKFAFGAFADDDEDRDLIAAIALQRGSERLGHPVRGEEVLVIGDTPLDIRCARAIGAKVLAVATGAYSVGQLQEHNPDWAVEDLSRISAAQLCVADNDEGGEQRD
jgi:phosphoglycolate phosphatase